MPYINLQIQPAPTAEQAENLASGITEAMADVMGKRREVTAVRIAGCDALLWAIGGLQCATTTAYLDVKITAGTNSAEQKAQLLKRLHSLLVDTFGGLAEASYIVIHELPADSWGYAGVTQAARSGAGL